jgi:hypothetical protein
MIAFAGILAGRLPFVFVFVFVLGLVAAIIRQHDYDTHPELRSTNASRQITSPRGPRIMPSLCSIHIWTESAPALAVSIA